MHCTIITVLILHRFYIFSFEVDENKKYSSVQSHILIDVSEETPLEGLGGPVHDTGLP